MKKVLLAPVVFFTLFFLSLYVFPSHAKTIDMDGSFDDWDDVSVLIEDTIEGYPYSGTIYYFNTGTNTWGTDSIADTCMYTQNRALDLGELRLTNDNDNLYILWKRGSDFLNYYWRRGDATEEISFSNSPAIEYQSNPCEGEVITAPVAFDHDLVLSIDVDGDDSFDYYLVINVTFAEGAYSGYDTAGYIYEDSGDGVYSSGTETLLGEFGESDYEVSPSASAVDSAVLQEVKMDIGEILTALNISWGDTVTVKYEAHSEASDSTDTAEYTFEQTSLASAVTNIFKRDTRCHWSRPAGTTWIDFEPQTKEGVSGMYLTWVQYGADKLDILIDDGTGNFPWKVAKTTNDGNEFLPNVAGWQDIKLKPYNHCKSGNAGKAVSANMYPWGWYNTL